MHTLGIDLGTTHTVLAWADGPSEAPVIEPIAQEIPEGRERLPMLPSVLYAPLAHETLTERWCAPPWITGELARLRGLEVAGRSVVSAKSWLCHDAVDPSGPILPFGAGDDVPRISAVDASARYLEHVRRAFEDAHGPIGEGDADVVLTVPASFHEGARALTLEAARRAGLPGVRLLEEPQAAFHDFLEGRPDDELLALCRGRDALRVLVLDVGGGTTDLSVIVMKCGAEGLDFERVATGDHLLLGGDNMDLALAALCERELGLASLSAARRGQLVVQCRRAKEVLLARDAPEDAPVMLAAEGSRLVGGTRGMRLRAGDVERVVLDGFFPVEPMDSLPRGGRIGLVTTGLPYARDAAITRHVAAFLARHEGGVVPDAVLFNGGVFASDRLRARVLGILGGWKGAPVVELPVRDPLLAVARGAVAHGFARRGRGRRIVAGASRTYYLGVGETERGPRGVCLIPRGTREGEPCDPDRVFRLKTGRLARFELWRAESAVRHVVGEVVELDAEGFSRLPALLVRLEGDGAELDVTARAELTALGTLDVSLSPASTNGRRLALEFQIRRGDAPAKGATTPPTSVGGKKAPAAIERVLAAFASNEPRLVKDLLRDLEKILGERDTWDAGTARLLADALLGVRGGRRRSADHERVFFWLSGFLLRPGFGVEGDAARVESFFPLWSQKLAFPDRTQGWQAFFIAFRRIAAGLDEPMQLACFEAVAPFFDDGRKIKKKRTVPLAPEEMRELVSWLERLPAHARAAFGAARAEETWTQTNPRLFADIARVGARVPLYTSRDHALAAAVVEPWLEQWLRLDWRSVPDMASHVVRLTRLTGDPRRDVREGLRRDVEKRLLSLGAGPEHVRPLNEIVRISTDERARSFGDALPAGLGLAEDPG